MISQRSRRTISNIYDAALAPDLWPAALQSVMDEAGAGGAGYSLFNKRTERVEWLSQSGPLVGREADYFSHYHALDRYRPILEVLPAGRWLWISECLPETVLRRDEWYNDYLLRAGIDDALSARLCESASHVVVFGVSHGNDRAPFTAAGTAALQELLEPLAKAARLHTELGSLGWEPAIALRALDQLAAAVIVADSDGRVIQANRADDPERQTWCAARLRRRAARGGYSRSGCGAENRGSNRTHAHPTARWSPALYPDCRAGQHRRGCLWTPPDHDRTCRPGRELSFGEGPG